MTKRVLIIDDAVELGRMLRAAVESLAPGLEVRLFPSAEEAQLELLHSPYDLLIADIRLPGMSGIDLTCRLRDNGNEIKIFLITGMTAKDLGEKAREAGADRFLLKPFLMSEFMAVTAELLEIQPSAPIPAAPAPAQKSRIAVGDIRKILQRLHNRLGSSWVVLIHSRGTLTALVGNNLPHDFEEQWVPPILAALNGLRKVSRLVNPDEPRGAVVLPGDHQQLILTPVGRFVLAVVLGEDSRGLRSALALEEVLDARDQLRSLVFTQAAEQKPAETLETAATAGMEPAAEVQPDYSDQEAAWQTETEVDESVITDAQVEASESSVDAGQEDLPSAAEAVLVQPEPPASSPFIMPPDASGTALAGPFTSYSEEELDDLKTILDETRPPADQQSADDYWEQGLTQAPKPLETSEGLTYEEASRLGLIPDQD